MIRYLKGINTGKASGPDAISGHMLKGASESIAPVLKHLFNSSLRSSDIPTEWIRSSIVPIPKGAKPTSDPKCYRPISLLPIVSKVLERHVYNVVWEHLEDTGQIPDNQWGFTQGKSTVTALLSTLNSAYHYMEQGVDVILLFLDLSQAFDRVSHVPLLHHA